MSVVTLTGGDDHGEAYRRAAQAFAQVLIRAAGVTAFPDAGPLARGEREGAGDADGASGEVEQVRGGEDQGEGEPHPRSPTQDFFAAPQAAEWDWKGPVPAHSHSTLGRPHVYLSTGCYHGDHGYCGSGVRGDGGAKRPAQCKFCDARCMCPCHPAPPFPGSMEVQAMSDGQMVLCCHVDDCPWEYDLFQGATVDDVISIGQAHLTNAHGS